MSRCFPYPPPGYCRNGAAHEALIESIKLQKTDKARSERRKEKREKKEKKEKKKEEKEKKKNDEKLKLQNKLLQKEKAGFTDGKKPNTEVLEKSDLTQENGQPIKPCYSSDSTQNSNKRRREDDDDLLPDDSTGHGKHIKIRLLKKHKESDVSNSGEDKRTKTVPLVPSSDRSNGVPATSGRENIAQGVPLTQTKSNIRFERPTECNPNGLFGREQSASGSSVKPTLPSGSRKSDVDVLKSSRPQQQLQHQQQIASFVRPVVSQSQLKHEVPSSTGVSRNMQGPNTVRHQLGPSTLKPVVHSPVLNKPSPISTGKRPINEVSVPSSSGPTKVQKEDPKKVGPTRAEKKMLKKQAKYEKLIGSWTPPVFQAIFPNVVDDEEDWLTRRTKPANQSISRGEVESCRELPTTSSLCQPRARFMAEADIYALPYTVPF